jgi:cation diffusion facilitator CzcD-associated flavoprotein CzcO
MSDSLATTIPAVRVALKTDIVVIGAGQAGLSSAYHLKRRGLAPDHGFIVLDGSPQPGGAWQFRWPSLRLSTVNRIHDLPGMRFSEVVDTNATEVEASVAVPQYYAAYEKAFGLPVYRPVKVAVVCDRGERLRIETDRGDVSARGIINATGTWETPYIPDVPGAERFTGRQLHTRDYRTAEEFAGKHVLIVGGGISAIQLLDEISHVTTTTWVTRRPPEFRAGPLSEEQGRAAVALVEDRVRRRPAAAVGGISHRVANHACYSGDARARGAGAAANVQRNPGRWRPLGGRQGASCRCDPLVHRVSQLARSPGAADAARSWRRHHDEWQIGHTGGKEPQDSSGRLRPVCIDYRCKSCWWGRGK